MEKENYMLDKQTASQPNAIIDYFCVPFGKLPVQAMSDEMGDTMMHLMFATLDKSGAQDQADKNLDSAMSEQGGWVYVAMKKRIAACLNVKFDVKSMTFICCVAQGIGACLMYAYYMQYYAKIHGLKEITMEVLGDAFPDGFPADDSLRTLWYNMKVRIDDRESNLIDCASLESILL